MTRKNNKPYALHSNEIQDIISAVPPWILRWGIGVFFVLLALLLSLSAIIKYPDIVNTQMTICSYKTTALIATREKSILNKILVQENQLVDSGLNVVLTESVQNHKKVMLKTSARGFLHYSSYLKQNELLAEGQDIFYIEPEHSSYIGKIALKTDDIAKARRGAKVIIKINEAVADEKIISVRINSITRRPDRNDLFVAWAALPDEVGVREGSGFHNGAIVDVQIISGGSTLLEKNISFNRLRQDPVQK